MLIEFVDCTQNSCEKKEENHPSSHALAAINYLEELIKKIKNGEVHTFTSIALLKDEKASMWIPGSIDDENIQGIYDPIIQTLQNCSPLSTSN